MTTALVRNDSVNESTSTQVQVMSFVNTVMNSRVT